MWLRESGVGGMMVWWTVNGNADVDKRACRNADLICTIGKPEAIQSIRREH